VESRGRDDDWQCRAVQSSDDDDDASSVSVASDGTPATPSSSFPLFFPSLSLGLVGAGVGWLVTRMAARWVEGG
jgi:hypothetical protein